MLRRTFKKNLLSFMIIKDKEMATMKEQGYVRPEDDFFETPKEATCAMLAHIKIPEDVTLWECAAGYGKISKILEKVHNKVLSTELSKDRYGIGGVDFLLDGEKYKPEGRFWIVTNPPFKYANDFIRKAFAYGAERVICLLRFNYCESGKVREDILGGGHLLRVLLMKERLSMAPYGWKGKVPKATQNHAWFVFDKNFNAPEKSEFIVRRISLKEGKAYAYLHNIPL